MRIFYLSPYQRYLCHNTDFDKHLRTVSSFLVFSDVSLTNILVIFYLSPCRIRCIFVTKKILNTMFASFYVSMPHKIQFFFYIAQFFILSTCVKMKTLTHFFAILFSPVVRLLHQTRQIYFF